MHVASLPVFLLLAAGLTAACGNDDGGEPAAAIESFYIEADITIWENSRGVGTNVADGTEPDERRGTIRWWSLSPSEFRQELAGTGDDGGDGITLIVGSGALLSYYTSDTNEYREAPMPELPEGIIGWPIPASFFLGPAHDEELGSGVEAAVAVLESVNDRDEGVVELERERIAGRPVRVFEWGPVGCSQTTTVGGAEGEVRCSGTATAWVDADTGFFLGFLAQDPDVVRIEVLVTRIDYAPVFDDGLFEFDPPPGAVEVSD